MPDIKTCPMSSRDMVYEDEDLLTVEIEQLFEHLQHVESQRVEELPEMVKNRGHVVAEIAHIDQSTAVLTVKKWDLQSVLKKGKHTSSRHIAELQTSRRQCLQGMTYEEVESTIELMESKLCVETMSLKEEKWLVEATSLLRRARSKVQTLDYKECVESTYLKSFESELTAQIASIDAKLKNLQDKRIAKNAELAKITHQIDLRKSIRARFIRMQHCRMQFLAEQAIQFCQNMMSIGDSMTSMDDCDKAVEDPEPIKDEGIDIGSSVPTSSTKKQFMDEEKNGTLQKLEREDEEDCPSLLCVSATRAKKMEAGRKKGKSNKCKRTAATGARVECSVQPVMHTMQSFNIFAKLRIDPPMTTTELPKTLQRLMHELHDHRSKANQAEVKTSGLGGA